MSSVMISSLVIAYSFRRKPYEHRLMRHKKRHAFAVSLRLHFRGRVDAAVRGRSPPWSDPSARDPQAPPDRPGAHRRGPPCPTLAPRPNSRMRPRASARPGPGDWHQWRHASDTRRDSRLVPQTPRDIRAFCRPPPTARTVTNGVSLLQTNELNSTCRPSCHGHTLPPRWSKACHPARYGGVYDHHHRVYHSLLLSG